MGKKPGYTLDQHEALGLELQLMRDRLVSITTELGRAYPLKVSNLAKKSWNDIDALRCELDNRVCDENRDFAEATRVYYRSNRADYVRPTKLSSEV